VLRAQTNSKDFTSSIVSLVHHFFQSFYTFNTLSLSVKNQIKNIILTIVITDSGFCRSLFVYLFMQKSFAELLTSIIFKGEKS